jgi:signal transduction histidine kinase
VAVSDGGELLGALAVTRLPDDWLAPNEDKLLRDLARQAGLILRNVRLVEELRSSRARIVRAQDDERRRLQRNLHDGAQQQFVLASLHVGRARHMLAGARREEVDGELEDASEQLLFGLAELRNLARGLHPTIVSLSGLAPALESLAERSQLPVTLESTIERRYPISVESTAYYLVSEALTNATKHAHASAVAVRAWEERDRLLVEVIDDGVGGADPAHGSGLRGLEDRVAALGGQLRVESQHGRGTKLMAELRNGC